MTDLLNKAQVIELFQREAILFGDRDAMPKSRAIELFGAEAVDFAERMGKPQDRLTGYGVGDYTAFGLTLCGVRLAATYCNVRLLQKKEATNGGE